MPVSAPPIAMTHLSDFRRAPCCAKLGAFAPVPSQSRALQHEQRNACPTDQVAQQWCERIHHLVVIPVDVMWQQDVNSSSISSGKLFFGATCAFYFKDKRAAKTKIFPCTVPTVQLFQNFTALQLAGCHV